MNPREYATYALVVVAVALVVVVAAVAGAALFGGGAGTVDADADPATDEPPAEYAPESVIAEPIESTGEVTVPESLRAGDAEAKTVVIDTESRVESEDIQPLMAALIHAGHEVRFRQQDLEASLAGADAYLRIDPGIDLDASEVDAVRNFTDAGGRVLLVGEPNRVRISTGLFSSSTSVVRTEMTGLASEYGIVFDTRYLYDTETNDGNFKSVLAEPTDRDAAPDLDRVALYTATSVEARGGQVLLRTPPTTELSNGGPAERYPVAVRTGNVLALGDKTLMTAGRHNVADNEAFLQYVLGFVLSGDRSEPATPPPEPSGTPAETPTETPTPTAAPTPTGNTTAVPPTA